MREGSPVIRGHPDDPLAALGLFQFRAHGAQIVGSRNYRKEHHKDATESEHALQGTKLMGIPRTTPQPPGGYGQQQPREIEQQFH
jgi:hypothetical protein